MGRAKALLLWRDEPFVAHCIGMAAAAGCAPIVVVSGAVELPPAATRGATVVRNDAWERGQMSSMQVGVRATQGSPRAVVLLTVDRPHVSPQTVRELVAASREAPRSVWQPSYEGRRGHPVLVPPDVAAMVIAAGPDVTLRDVLADPAVVSRRRSLPCADPAVRQNLDRPDDLALLPS